MVLGQGIGRGLKEQDFHQATAFDVQCALTLTQLLIDIWGDAFRGEPC